jgi:hypothetical protein
MTITAQTIVDHSLLYWLQDFQVRFNANSRAAKLTAGWDRQLLLEPTDSDERYLLTVAGARLTEIREGAIAPGTDERLVTMSAEEATLIEIFSGVTNPSTALIDGQLEVYSDSRDKVKLEALALVIWGL